MIPEYKKLDERYAKYRELGRRAERYRSTGDSYGENEYTQRYAEEAYSKADAIEVQRSELLDTMKQDFDLVDNIGTRYILVLRYVNGMRWKEIAQRTRYALSHVKRLRTNALKEIAERKKTIPNETQ